MGRCTGHCCARFSLPLSPMELKHQARRQAAKLSSKYPGNDLVKISEMVIYLGEFYYGTPHPLLRGVKKKIPVPYSKDSKIARAWHYTCRHYDEKTGNCRNYRNRPEICRHYPSNGSCKYRGCTYNCGNKEEVCEKASIPVDRPTPGD